MKVIATKGLPGSGKTCWARQRQAEDPSIVLVDKDSLRECLHGGKWSPYNEVQVKLVRDYIIRTSLSNGRSVIVHDTNLEGDHLERLRFLATQHGAEFEVQDFTDIPVEVCISRDRLRKDSVGEKVIRDMAERVGLA